MTGLLHSFFLNPQYWMQKLNWHLANSVKHLYRVCSGTWQGTFWNKLLCSNKWSDWNHKAESSVIFSAKGRETFAGWREMFFVHLWHQKWMKGCGCEPACSRWWIWDFRSAVAAPGLRSTCFWQVQDCELFIWYFIRLSSVACHSNLWKYSDVSYVMWTWSSSVSV